jgi:fatty-acyl-CoA synthase
MNSLMQDDYPLTVQHVLWRCERLLNRKEIVSRREQGTHRYRYPDLAERVSRLAGSLRRLGIGEGDRVGTLAWNNYRHLELYYAVPCMGAVLHTLNLRLFPDQLAFVIEDAEDKVIFVDRTLIPILARIADRIPSVETIVVMSDDGPPADNPLGETLDYETLLAAESSDFPWPQLDERSAAAMCYTSGTTGNPKGVVYSHRSQFLHSMGTLSSNGLGMNERDSVLAVVPMFHANSWGIPYGAALAGATLLFPDRFMGDGKAIIDLAEEENATVMAGVPTIWMNVLGIMRETGRRLPNVREVICGGSAVPRPLMEGMDAVGLRVLHAWGMTETSPLGSVAMVPSWATPEEELSVRLSQGPPAVGVEIRIADLATGEEVPWDGTSIGEIQCRGPWIARAYYHDADPDKFTEDGWLRTGDVATMDADGYMRIVDRTKDVIKSGGEWISSVELEGMIMAHPKVQEAAVVGLPHPKWSERPVAYVVPRPEYKGQVTKEEILDFLRDRVARFWLPDDVRFIDEVPKTSVGKFDKKQLRSGAEPIPAVTEEAGTTG